jgi:hypothetical protein
MRVGGDETVVGDAVEHRDQDARPADGPDPGGECAAPPERHADGQHQADEQAPPEDHGQGRQSGHLDEQRVGAERHDAGDHDQQSFLALGHFACPCHLTIQKNGIVASEMMANR